jgi:hypothetical protein
MSLIKLNALIVFLANYTVAIILWNGGGYQFHHKKNGIDGVTVSVLVSSEVYRWFESRSDQTKDYAIGICN